MKPHTPEYIEGPEAWKRFNAAMGKVMGVSHEELQRRIAAEKEKAAAQPSEARPETKA